ncbi:GNAT family N-acetyltransferase [Paenibacillus sp. RC67]|uniref:GNAT family N-acetyltransferase n=1 Tax=Paenibacillus sp. RC67 TaxID=3039392 RepID=UPI0024AC9014|nr:GNAT family N-acetyltransferase [Paenibacillus sp. RC67]
MSKLSLEELVWLWNKGFEGYFVPIAMDVDKFMARAVNEGLSLDHSIMMYEKEEPIGFVINGFRWIGGRKVAWNGGTGIVPAYRGKGVGKQLMHQNILLYQKQNVEIALLEAIAQNEPAIKLYRHAGYDITERLITLQCNETLNNELQVLTPHPKYLVRRGLSREVELLAFYRSLSAWQTQWPSIREGECLIVSDCGETVGYLLLKRVLGEDGMLVAVTVYQCEAMPCHADTEAILSAALQAALSPLDHTCKRVAVNLRESNLELISLLKRIGFTTSVEQVHMKLLL